MFTVKEGERLEEMCATERVEEGVTLSVQRVGCENEYIKGWM